MTEHSFRVDHADIPADLTMTAYRRSRTAPHKHLRTRFVRAVCVLFPITWRHH